MNESHSSSSSSNRFEAQKAFLESLDQLDDLMETSPPTAHDIESPKSSSSTIEHNQEWDEIAADLEQALNTDDL